MDRTTFMEMLGGATVGSFSQSHFTDVGTFSWVVPLNCFSISAVTVQGGQSGGNGSSSAYGGKGGDLRYKNAIPVTPGETLTITVGAGGVAKNTATGADGAHTSIARGSTVLLSSSMPIGSGIGGGNGGGGGQSSPYSGVYGTAWAGGGGGGAGGYSGQGGQGAGRFNSASSGTGGGGGGGGDDFIGGSDVGTVSVGAPAADGGGVGLSGQGIDGAAGVTASPPTAGGKGSSETPRLISPKVGGGGASGISGFNGNGGSTAVTAGNNGASGGARLIWPGNVRSYPSTRTADE